MKEFLKTFWFVFAAIGFLTFLAHHVYVEGKENHANYATQQQTAYHAWLKIFPDKKITFDEWNALRLNNALPR